MKTLVFLLLVAAASAKVYERCEWAKVLKSHGMDGFSGYSLANWVCLTQHESNFWTTTTNHNTDGSTDYGIFQINSRWWCNNGQTKTSNACRISCSELLTDNVAVAINCAKIVVQDRRKPPYDGLGAWVAWRKHCKGEDLSSYLAGCDL